MSEKTKLSLVRTAISMIAGSATYAVTKAVIKNNVAEPENKTQKVTLAVGSFVVAEMVADKTAQYVNDQISSWERAFKIAKQKSREQKMQDIPK